MIIPCFVCPTFWRYPTSGTTLSWVPLHIQVSGLQTPKEPTQPHRQHSHTRTQRLVLTDHYTTLPTSTSLPPPATPTPTSYESYCWRTVSPPTLGCFTNTHLLPSPHTATSICLSAHLLCQWLLCWLGTNLKGAGHFVGSLSSHNNIAPLHVIPYMI